MKHLSNDRGALPILMVALALVLVAVIGVAAYNFSQVSKKDSQSVNTSPSPAGSPATTTSPAADPTANWNTSTSTLAKYSIKYPGDWTYRTSTNNGGAETIYITSPNKLEISLTSFTQQSGYGQDALRANPDGTCSACLATNSSETFNAAGYGSLSQDVVTYGAGGGSVNELILRTPNKSMYIVSPKVTSVYTSVQALFQSQSQQTSAQFAVSDDVETAKQILKTLSY